MRQNVIIETVPEDLVHKLTKEKTGDSMQVGLNIKIKRIGRGYTQEEIADAIGVARSTYTRYESDKRLPDIYKLCALADYFVYHWTTWWEETETEKRSQRAEHCDQTTAEMYIR